MSQLRRKWRVQSWTSGGPSVRSATSQAEAYRVVRDICHEAGRSRVHGITVQVDERQGAGWQVFERLDPRTEWEFNCTNDECGVRCGSGDYEVFTA